MAARGFGLPAGAIAALCVAAPALSATAAEPPRIVLQAEDAAGVEVAAWTPDGRYLITASANSRSLILWDLKTGEILDRQQAPVGEPGDVISFMAARLTDVRPAIEQQKALYREIESHTELSDEQKALMRQAMGEAFAQPEFAVPGLVVGLVLNVQVISSTGVKEVDIGGALRALKDVTPNLPGAGADQARRAIIRLQKITTNPPARRALADYQVRQSALASIYEASGEMTRAKADAVLPALPASPDGRYSLRRDVRGLQVLDAAGKIVRTLGHGAPTAYVGAALSPDGNRLALIDDLKRHAADGTVRTPMHSFDIRNAAPRTDVELEGAYGAVAWLDPQRVVVTPDWSPGDREIADRSGPPAPARVINMESGREREAFPSRCYQVPLPGGGFVGAGLANCRFRAGSDRSLQRLGADGTWRPFALEVTKGRWVNALAVSPDGARLALLVQDEKASVSREDGFSYEYQPLNLLVLDLATQAVLRQELIAQTLDPRTVLFQPDGQSVLVGGGRLVERDGQLHRGPGADGTWSATDGTSVLASSVLLGGVSRGDLKADAAMPALTAPAAIAGGFVPGRPLFWAVSAVDGLRLFDTRTWRPILTSYQFEGGGYLTVAPDGRYDTNLGADSDRFRWLFADAPLRPVAPQTFMRDYYEPQLAQRLQDCATAGNCEAVFPPVRPLQELNRTLPVAKVAAVRPAEPGAVYVDVEASEGVDAGAPNGKTRSGVHDLRLFRDGKLVAQWPAPRPAVPGETQVAADRQWAAETELKGAEGGATLRQTFKVAIPQQGDGKPVKFTAYAFNDDRVKGETAEMTFTPALVDQPRPRRAYVIAVGVNAYTLPGKSLNFAVNDAGAVADALRAIPGYETVTVRLVADAAQNHAAKADLKAVLAKLAGQSSGDARLAAAGIDVSKLRAATPDDLVILSFSGHGYADDAGRFFLLPSDAAQTADERLDLTSLVSSAELTDWLRGVDAGEMAIIIDACHSGASVTAGGFKPGPMGDPGLGQLAFDKGIRILAATQADDVAMEDRSLQQGLLTYALVHDGLGVGGAAKAPQDDGRVRLDALLKYAVERMPGLAGETTAHRLAGRAVQSMLVPRTPPVHTATHVQQPALFDFTGTESTVRLPIAPPG